MDGCLGFVDCFVYLAVIVEKTKACCKLEGVNADYKLQRVKIQGLNVKDKGGYLIIDNANNVSDEELYNIIKKILLDLESVNSKGFLNKLHIK